MKLVGVNDGEATIELSEIKPWSIENPYLYDLAITVTANGEKEKVVFRLRKLSLDDKGLKINDKRVFQRLVLDQDTGVKEFTFPNPPTTSKRIFFAPKRSGSTARVSTNACSSADFCI
ncbi:MAG: hypothetical protein ACLUSP_05050 [Christensenellales bacterium]